MPDDNAIDIKILYVEDDRIARDEVSRFLGRRVRDVVTAGNGREGLEAYDRARPDLIVTDIRMPVMDGLQMAREIRTRDPDIKIIVTSAHSDTSYLLTTIDMGIDGYVIKPVDTARLSAAIAKCAEVIEYRREKRRYEEERERLVEELRGALDKVKLLSGLLPICASCKKIKDDNGYWQQIEAYIRDHSEAEFSHGLCPDCSKRLYPQYHREP